jgi:hypothetical protein
MTVHLSRARRAAAGLVALVAMTTVLGACGGAPSRDDFVERSRATLGDDLMAAMKDRGISRSEADEIIDTFLTCQYEALKSDLALLEKAYDDPADAELTAEIDSRTTTCVSEMSVAMTDAADPAPPTTIPEFTTLPPETLPPETLPPETLPPETLPPETTVP